MEINDTTIALLATALWAISEALGFSKKIKANGIFQAIFMIAKKLAGK